MQIDSITGWPTGFNQLAFYGSTFDPEGIFYVANQEAIELIRIAWPTFAAWKFVVV